MNGLLRAHYPKGMDLSEIDRDKLKTNPRKCIDYKTPNEVCSNEHLHQVLCSVWQITYTKKL